jgi:hypothetical protein
MKGRGKVGRTRPEWFERGWWWWQTKPEWFERVEMATKARKAG